MELRYRTEKHKRHVQIGEPIYGPGNQTAVEHYNTYILQYRDNEHVRWQDVPIIPFEAETG